MQLGATIVAQLCVDVEKAVATCAEGDVAAFAAVLPLYEKLNAAYKDYVALFRTYLGST